MAGADGALETIRISVACSTRAGEAAEIEMVVRVGHDRSGGDRRERLGGVHRRGRAGYRHLGPDGGRRHAIARR